MLSSSSVMLNSMRHLGTSKNLVFTLPCLSNTEHNYINNQISTKTDCEISFSKKENLKLKYDAAASAYNISDKLSYDNMVKLFSSGCYQKRRGRKYSVYNPHLSSYLELGTILCVDTSEWLRKLSENKFNVKATLGKLAKSESNLEDKIKIRLLDVVEKLDLDLEHVIDSSEIYFDENGFSSSFYHNFMLECCGMTQEQSLKLRSSSRHKSFLRLEHDPINLVRTYYMLKEIFDKDIDVSLSDQFLLGRFPAVETLVSLNEFYSLTGEDLDEDERREKVLGGDNTLDTKIIDNLMTWDSSVTQCYAILQEIGFKRSEIDRLLFNFDHHVVTDIACRRPVDEHGFDIFLDIMRQRMALLDQEGVKLGIGDVGDKFNFLMHWDEVVNAIHAAGLDGKLCNIVYNRRKSFKIENLPYSRITSAASRDYILQYFGYSKKHDREQVKEIDKIFKRIPYAKDVPFKIVVESKEFLESINFSKEQIQKGFPILFYDKDIIQEKLEHASLALGDNWMEKENALCLLNYLIEVESNFSFTLIYSGILRNFQRGLKIDNFMELSSIGGKHV